MGISNLYIFLIWDELVFTLASIKGDTEAD